MKILVTGGVGKLGVMVVKSLVEEGHHINVFDLPHVDYTVVNSLPRVTTFKGDILNINQIQPACDGVDVALHLAAILPPYSETNAERTLRVNVKGTENVVKALETTSSAPLVFSSSVSVYGRTLQEDPPIGTSHGRQATDIYSKSKIMAEDALNQSRIVHTILRISGIYAALPFEFPSPVQFTADQRVEFIDREDVVTAFVTAIARSDHGHIFNIAGGESWQMRGEQFVEAVFKGFGVAGEVEYPSNEGYFDWYDTNSSQKLLNYQLTPFQSFQDKLSHIFG